MRIFGIHADTIIKYLLLNLYSPVYAVFIDTTAFKVFKATESLLGQTDLAWYLMAVEVR